MKNTLFAKLFQDEEPEIFREIEKLKNKKSLLIISLFSIAGLAFIFQLYAPVGLKISILVTAIWLVLLLASLSLLPSFIAAIKVFSNSRVKKSVALFIGLVCIFFGSVIYMVYHLIPFFLGGL